MDAELPDVVGLAALADPLRRRLYWYVVASAESVGREETARAVGIPVHTAKFHLDRLVEEGLLEVEFRRLTGRTGPGAGRPAKLYRRSAREFSVSLPTRHYDLLGDLLADAVAASTRQRALADEVVPAVAHRHGQRLGAESADSADSAGSADGAALEKVAAVLDQVGYEPRVEGCGLVLENCPFDRVARKHPALVCGLNVDFVQGVIDGLGCAGVTASLEPSPGRCCVSARSEESTGAEAGTQAS